MVLGSSGGVCWQRKAIDRELSKLPGDAPIRACVTDPAVEAALEGHERLDAVAIERQNVYYFWSQFGLWSVLIAGILGSLLLGSTEDIGYDAKLLIGLAQAISVGGVVLSFIVLHLRGQLRWWIETRAQAEVKRCDVFQSLLRAPGPAGAEAKVLARQKFDLIMNAHIKDQLNFYESACERHRHLPGHISILRWLGYAVFVVAMVIAATLLPAGLAVLFRLTGAAPPQWVVMAQGNIVAIERGLDADSLQRVLSALAASLLGFSGAWALLYQHDRHYCLYTENKRNLSNLLEADAGAAAAAADAGSLEKAKSLLDSSRKIMEAEHQVWRGVVQGAK